MIPTAPTERTRPILSVMLASCGLLLVVSALGCGGADEPQTLPPSPVPQVAPSVEPPAPAPPALPPPIREVSPTGGRGLVKVIDPGEPDDKPTTLIEASRLAKKRKREQRGTEPIATITDDNLAEFAKGADVIVLESEPAGKLPPLEDGRTGLDDGDIRDEDYWRDRALELRMGWRQAVDDIQELELESASLRQQFYAEEDPYIRDSQIKPAWDRVLDRLGALRQQAVRYENELDTFVQEGRRVGALDGWLNQGWELEPSREERDAIRRVAGDPDTTEVGEPEIVEPVDTSASQELDDESGGGR